VDFFRWGGIGEDIWFGCEGVGSLIDDAILSVFIRGPPTSQSQAGFDSMMVYLDVQNKQKITKEIQ
jgi:hypothetical protein